MKSFRVIEAEGDDMNLILIYQDDELIGLNFYHGMGEIHPEYFKNDPELFGLFCDSFSGLQEDLIKAVLNAVYALIDKIEVIDGICADADRMIEDLIERQEALLDTYGLEMTPEELREIKESKEQVKKQLRDMWKLSNK